MSYIILKGRWCDIIVMNIHAPSEDKIDDIKDRFYEEPEHVFDKFPKYHMKILLGDLNAKVERYKKREYLKDKIDELAMNSKNKNIRDLYRGINDFKRGYQPSSNLVKDESGDLLGDSHNILNRWRNYFSQLLNVHRVSDVRQTEIHTAGPLVPDPSPFEVAVWKSHRTCWTMQTVTPTPCDFWLFPKLKMPLKGARFESREDIMRNATARLITIPKDTFQKGFQQWRKRWEKCAHYQGDYFVGD
ncbi:hypothetical protein B7P43_G07852 [Cryptotermes secundus]|uniref:Endonuclease/exonuclease/phosphatase domain-containing protein n=1 Tax=Cryptotermes secundus TaxID=105785 RepID=A0A2J7QF62_9NEOP|nr:hypothetical protein B7P43_G07852 [Cryptotermes secundus]